MSEIRAYRVREAARLLGVTKKALCDQIAAKTVESYRAKGKRYVILPKDPPESPDTITVTEAKGPGQDLQEVLALVNCQADRITELSNQLDVIQAEMRGMQQRIGLVPSPARMPASGDTDSVNREVTESAGNLQAPVVQLFDTEPWHPGRSTPVWRDRSFLLKPLVVAAGLLALLVLGPLTPLPFSGSHAGVIIPRSQVTAVPIRDPHDPEYVPPHDTMRLPARASGPIRGIRVGAKHRVQRGYKG